MNKSNGKPTSISAEIERLRQMAVTALVAEYARLHGKPPRSKNREWLWKRIAWKLQERAFGGLSSVARDRLEELIADIELPPEERQRTVSGRLRAGANGQVDRLTPGKTIVRPWKGIELRLTVTDGGFEFDGTIYKSLSAAAEAATAIAQPAAIGPGRSSGWGGIGGRPSETSSDAARHQPKGAFHPQAVPRRLLLSPIRPARRRRRFRLDPGPTRSHRGVRTEPERAGLDRATHPLRRRRLQRRLHRPPGAQAAARRRPGGAVDLIAIYKIDRLSRSLADFSRLMALLEEHHVGFVSITQSFDTSTSAGKLMMNILMSFSEFERATIAERTRDKMLATRRKGRWTGGHPPLGYDVVEKKLVVNEAEGERVRDIFRLFVTLRSAIAVVTELRRRGWTNKQWTTKAGDQAGGTPFDKATLVRLLKNPVVVGRMHAGGDVVDGEHQAIVPTELWDAAQLLLSGAQGRTTRPYREPKRWPVLLAGIVQCGACGRRMTHSYASRGSRRWHSYACLTAQKHGAAACPGARVPARDLDDAIVSRIQAIGKSPKLAAEVLAAVKKNGNGAARIDEHSVVQAVRDFEPLWSVLSQAERGRIVRLLVEQVVYHPTEKEVEIRYRPSGFSALLEDSK